MKEIKAKKPTATNFAPFGTFYRIDKPEGLALCGELHCFYPDRLTTNSGTKNLAFSTITVKKPDTMLVTAAEYHTTTCEIIMALNDSMVIHVAPPSGGVYPADYTEAFVFPKNTLVKLNAAVWHLAPLPAKSDKLCAMILLPECTYANDCTVVNLKSDEQFTITL